MSSDPLFSLLRESWPESMPCAPYAAPSPEQLINVRERLRQISDALRLSAYTPLQRQALAGRRGHSLHQRLTLCERLLSTWGEVERPQGFGPMLPLIRDLSARERRHRRLFTEARLLTWGVEDGLLLLSIELDLLADRVLTCPTGPRPRRGHLLRPHPARERGLRPSRPGFWLRELQRALRLHEVHLSGAAEQMRALRLRLSVPFLNPTARRDLQLRAVLGERQLSWSTARTRSYFGEITRATGVTAAMMTFLIDRWRAMEALWREAQRVQTALQDAWLLIGALGRHLHDEILGRVQQVLEDPGTPRRQHVRLSNHFGELLLLSATEHPLAREPRPVPGRQAPALFATSAALH